MKRRSIIKRAKIRRLLPIEILRVEAGRMGFRRRGASDMKMLLKFYNEARNEFDPPLTIDLYTRELAPIELINVAVVVE